EVVDRLEQPAAAAALEDVLERVLRAAVDAAEPDRAGQRPLGRHGSSTVVGPRRAVNRGGPPSWVRATPPTTATAPATSDGVGTSWPSAIEIVAATRGIR